MVDLQHQKFRNMNILHVKLIEVTHIVCLSCGFWRSLPFCLAITVTPVIRSHEFKSFAFSRDESLGRL